MKLGHYFKDFHIDLLFSLIVILAILDFVYKAPHLGIEFVGGTEIPVQLEHPVNPDVMTQLINTLQQRLTTFGLKQVTVEGIGNSEVLIEIPSVSQSDIESTISLIESQGVFQGIVGGREALNESSIVAASIGSTQSQVGNEVVWNVTFLLTPQGSARFSKVVFGQANKPLYMFLNRPNNAVVALNSSIFSSESLNGINASVVFSAISQATELNNSQIPVIFYNSSNINQSISMLSSYRKTYNELIIAKNAPIRLISAAKALNYSIKLETLQNITPSFMPTSSGYVINYWPAIGLLSAPILSPSITNGTTSISSMGYQISGFAPSNLSLSQKMAYAQNESNLLVSILKGGALPVPVVVSPPSPIPPTLGTQVEKVSIMALVAAVVTVSIAISLRYKRLFLVFPIIFTTLAELFIIVSIIGLIGTIDVAAVAGMIAVIGTGVDAQIIITDEFIGKRGDYTDKIRLSHAFYIIWADALLLVIAMLPLFFSTSMVQIVGFAESTILGVLFGALITRPAYGAMISKHFSQLEKEKA